MLHPKLFIINHLHGPHISFLPLGLMKPPLVRIVGFRNRIIHGYDAVDDATVWGIVNEHLPRLLNEVQALLGEAGETT